MSADSNRTIFGPANCALLIIKVGSSLLVEPDGQVRRAWLQTLVADIAARRSAGQKIAIVSSGAIALGAKRLKLEKGGRASLADAQAAASVGQIILSSLWAELLGRSGLIAAQMLVTLDDLEDRRRYLNIAATTRRLLDSGAVPVINENDSVATEEIRFGDNDRLAARVGQAAGAAGVILLSDVDGLYDRDPKDPAAQIVSRIETVDEAIRAMVASGSSSGMGSGGMASKLEAASIAGMAGIPLAIISGLKDHPLTAFDRGGPGSYFAADGSNNARKSWLGGRLTAKGKIFIDPGAASALARGGSLLPAGAISVEGRFARSDVVEIICAGKLIARGLCEYDADDALLICGKQSHELAGLLGTVPRSVLVHRDQMVMLS